MAGLTERKIDSTSLSALQAGDVLGSITPLHGGIEENVYPTIEIVQSFELENLFDADVALLTLQAGLGHYRTALAVAHAFCDGNRYKLIRTQSIASNVHSIGSNNFFAKTATEIMQKHDSIQHLVAGLYHHTILQNDTDSVLLETKQYLGTTTHKNVYMVAFHPHISLVLSMHKEELEKKFDRKIHLVTVMTDHLPHDPQFIWYLLGTDLLITPDSKSKRLAERELHAWKKLMYFRRKTLNHLPEVFVLPYPVDPHLTELLPEQAWRFRTDQVDPNKHFAMQILLPMGGSLPQKEYLGQLTYHLECDPINANAAHVIAVAKHTTDHQSFFDELTGYGTELITDKTNDGIIEKYNHVFRDRVPSLTITKPSEIAATLPLLEPNMAGGTILLFTNPVGNQEAQNLDWLREKGLVPDMATMDRLLTAVLNYNYTDLEALLPEATEWRGVCLPPDAQQAALFILQAKEMGLFEQMIRYKKNEGIAESAIDGATQFWRLLNGFAAKFIR